MPEEILLTLSITEGSNVMELAIIDNTTKGSKAHKLLYPLAVGISVILEEDPSFLYEAGTELYNGDVYLDMESTTKH
mgnify:CR=1 FL=1